MRARALLIVRNVRPSKGVTRTMTPCRMLTNVNVENIMRGSKRSTPLDVKKCQGSGRRSQNRKGEASGCKNKNQLRETGRVEADRCHAVTGHAFLQGRKRAAGTL